MTDNENEAKALEMIKAKNPLTLVVASKQEDYEGVDLYINRRKVDLKGESTLQKYPNTLLISVGISKDGKNWRLPKYLEKFDTDVVVCDVAGGNDIFVLTPDILFKYYYGGFERKIKYPNQDYFGNYHKLVVVPKIECKTFNSVYITK